MKLKKVFKLNELGNGLIEIEPGQFEPLSVLKQMARLSYETAPCPFHHFIVPFEIESEMCDLSAYITQNRLQMDYVNGRLCDTYAYIEGKKIIFESDRFARHRGSALAFLLLLATQLGLDVEGSQVGGTGFEPVASTV